VPRAKIMPDDAREVTCSRHGRGCFCCGDVASREGAYFYLTTGGVYSSIECVYFCTD
jgi:hypothetical protein